MHRREYALKTFVKWVLAFRLLVTGILVAVVFGIIAYMNGYKRIGEAVVLTARNGIEWIRVDVKQLRDSTKLDLREAVQQVLDTGTSYQTDHQYGQFTYVRFYGPRGDLLSERAMPVDTDVTILTHTITTIEQQFPDIGEVWQKNIEIVGHPYIHMVLPIEDRYGALVAWCEGLFRVSSEAVIQVRRGALQTGLYVGLIVLVTALLLYPVILTLMRRLAHYSENLLVSNLETLEVLGNAIAKRDSDTDAHNYRVTLYSLRLAETVGLDADRVRALIKGAFLHDVGKIGIRDNILLKPGRLDAEEFSVMKTHVKHGHDIVSRSRWLADAEDVVNSHHEKYDGSGYPKQMAGEMIPIEARIFAIADVFDALTSHRPYKEPLSFEETMSILNEGSGQHFDPELLEQFGIIASDLYKRYGGRDDDELRQELRDMVNRYFTGGLDTLRY